MASPKTSMTTAPHSGDAVAAAVPVVRIAPAGSVTAMRRQEKADRIGEILDELYPRPPVPLDHTDPYTLLVAVVLSALTVWSAAPIHLGDGGRAVWPVVLSAGPGAVVGAVIARAPRGAIDPNRAPDALEPNAVEGAAPPPPRGT